MSEVFLGFDPGGAQGFGVAWLRGVEVKAKTVSSVADAIDWAVTECHQSDPFAAGIDAMLCWCDGPGGWRPSDRWLRDTYPAARSSVISPNGLYGSMGIGGMALAMRLRQRWPRLGLNETHPKVLAYAMRGELRRDDNPPVAWLAQHAALDMTRVSGGHEFDAVFSAWATREGLARNWSDLVANDPALLLPVGTVSYLWPEPLGPRPLASNSSLPKSRESGRRASRQTTAIG